MSSITVRKIPAEVISSIKKRASLHGRSMESEVRAILEEASMERSSLLDAIEKEVGGRTRRPTTRRQVDGWIRTTRSRRK